MTDRYPDQFGLPDSGRLAGRMWNGECISCLTATDTILGVEGVAEWHIAFLVQFEIPESEASAIVGLDTNCRAGEVPSGRWTQFYRVCRTCVEKAQPQFPLPVLSLSDAVVPVIGQLDENDGLGR